MHLIVCIKQTPKTEQVKIDPATGCLIRTDEGMMNPFDEHALEAAVTLKEQLGGRVSAVTMGPPQAEQVLRDAVARGADAVYHLCGAEFAGSDTWGTAYALSKAVEKISAGVPVLVLCGQQTTDSDTGHVGPQVAAWLNWPQAAFVKKIIRADEKTLSIERAAQGGSEIIKLPLPCVIAVGKEAAVPRVSSVKGRLAAKTAPVTRWTADDIGADKNNLGAANSPTRVLRSFTPQTQTAGAVLTGNTQEKAARLAAVLKANPYVKGGRS